LSAERDRGPFSQAGLQEFADQFELAGSQRVTGVRWYGSYFESDLLPEVNTAAFDLRFFADGNGLPSGNAYQVHSITASAQATGTMVENRVIYEFTAELPRVLLPEGVSWLSIAERGGESQPLAIGTGPWRWALSHQAGGDTAAAIQPGSVWSLALDRRNVAFTLLSEDETGMPTPEPATAAVVLGGLSLIVLLRRRSAQRS
jgi:hypothetical protein